MDGTNQRLIESLFSILRKELKTLLDCTERFHGEYNAPKIDKFLNYIEAYKSLKNISDEQSLAELPHLLRDHAYTWWKFHMNEMKTWNEAVQTLRQHFSRARPAHVIYSEIFGTPLDKSEKIDVFLHNKFELFAQLPQPQLKESMQLDMIFGMLPTFVQQQVKRIEVKNFAELMDRVKGLKQNQDNENIVNNPVLLTENTTPNNLVTTSSLSLPSRKRSGENLPETNNTKQPIKTVTESRIKVRRTEDLMAQIKEKDDQVLAVDAAQESEILNEANDVVKTEPEFQIDSELMHQINTIIESCDRDEATNTSAELNENDVANDAKQTYDLPHLTNSVKINNVTVCEDNNNSIIPSPINSLKFSNNTLAGTETLTTFIVPSNSPKQNRLRCNFCRLRGHLSSVCFKKKALLPQLDVIIQQQNTTQSSENPIATTITTTNATIAGDDGSFEGQTPLISKFPAPLTTISEDCSKSTSKLAPPGSISDTQTPSSSKFTPSTPTASEIHSRGVSSESQMSSAATKTTNNVITEISNESSKSQAPLSSKLTPSISSASECHTTLTTKLIPTVQVKQKHGLRVLAPKLTDSSNPAPKCHQCGMVGYYRSICPNCSPIYFYKPCRNNNQ